MSKALSCRSARWSSQRSCRTTIRSRSRRSSMSASTKRPTARAASSSLGGHAWDAGVLLQNAIPQALKKAQPGTKEFRRALRDALESARNLPAAHGVFNMTANDHPGIRSAGAGHGGHREQHLEADQITSALRRLRCLPLPC